VVTGNEIIITNFELLPLESLIEIDVTLTNPLASTAVRWIITAYFIESSGFYYLTS